MKGFGFWRDPLCVAACVAYALNRWLIAPHSSSLFLHNYFNDSLLIPAALPLLLWVQTKLELRPYREAPTFAEIAFHLLIWSIVCEAIGPRIFHHSVGDVRDVVAYGVGGLLAWAWWRQAPRLRFYPRFE